MGLGTTHSGLAFEEKGEQESLARAGGSPPNERPLFQPKRRRYPPGLLGLWSRRLENPERYRGIRWSNCIFDVRPRIERAGDSCWHRDCIGQLMSQG